MPTDIFSWQSLAAICIAVLGVMGSAAVYQWIGHPKMIWIGVLCIIGLEIYFAHVFIEYLENKAKVQPAASQSSHPAPSTAPTTQTQAPSPPQSISVSAIKLPPPMTGYQIPDDGFAPSLSQADQIVRSGRHFCEALTATPKNSAEAENFVIKGTEALKKVYVAYLRHVQADGTVVMMYAGWSLETQAIFNSINKSVLRIAHNLGWRHLLEGYDTKILPSYGSPLISSESLGVVEDLSLSLDRLWQEIVSVLSDIANSANQQSDDAPPTTPSKSKQASEKSQEREDFERVGSISQLIDTLHAHARWLDKCLESGDKPNPRAGVNATYAIEAANRFGVSIPQPTPSKGTLITIEQKWCMELAEAAEKAVVSPAPKNFLTDGSPTEAESPEREFVKPDLKYIRMAFENDTDINAQARVERYIGKWTETNGTVEDIQDAGTFINLRLDNSCNELPHFWLSFDLKWRDRLKLLDRARNVNVRGRISSIGAEFIFLQDCELIAEEEIDARDELKKHQEAMRSLQNKFERLTHEVVSRHISEAGLEAMRKSLAQYAGQKFTITIQIGDSYELVQNQEPQSFAVGLGIALRKCGWIGDAYNEFGSATGETGVGVYAVAVDGDAEWGAPIVRDLEHALQAEGIQLSEKIVIAHKARHNPNFKDKLIRIVVGRKPPLANDA